MSDFPNAPTGAPAASNNNINVNGNSYIQATKENATAAYEQLSNGPMAQNVKDQSAKASSEFGNLAAARKTPAQPAATGQALTHYHSFFFELLSWRNPRASGIAYGSIVTLILATRYLNVLSYSLKLTWMVLGTTVLAEVVGKLALNRGLASQVRPRSYYVISKDTLNAAIGDVHELINFFVIEAQRILFAENVGASAAAALGAFVAYFLVGVMPFWGLALTATTLLFLIPLVYTSNQEVIDQQLKQAGDVINEQTSQLRSVASKHTAQASEITKQYVGDYTAKAQQILGRTSPQLGKKVQPASDGVAPSTSNSGPFSAPPKVNESDFPTAPSTLPKTTFGEENTFGSNTLGSNTLGSTTLGSKTAADAKNPDVPFEPVVPEEKPMLAS